MQSAPDTQITTQITLLLDLITLRSHYLTVPDTLLDNVTPLQQTPPAAAQPGGAPPGVRVADDGL
jgi:hypothetical protein